MYGLLEVLTNLACCLIARAMLERSLFHHLFGGWKGFWLGGTWPMYTCQSISKFLLHQMPISHHTWCQKHRYYIVLCHLLLGFLIQYHFVLYKADTLKIQLEFSMRNDGSKNLSKMWNTMQTIEKLLSMISISQMCSVARNLELLLAHPKVWNPVNNWFTYVSWPATATTLNHCVLVFNVSPSSFLSFVLVLISILYLSNLITSFSALNHLRWNILADIYLTRSGQLSLHVDSIW